MIKFIDTLRARQRNRDTYRRLAGFDDHMLKDIGLTRHDLQLLRTGRDTASLL
jgi:uncharacterized protein YjiS (DUF1127 family)